MTKEKTLKAPDNALKNTLPKKIMEKFGSWCIDKKWYFLAFFLPVAVMLVTYFVFGIAPVGEESVLVLDLNGQYVYYYELLHDWFWGGHSIIYSWGRNLSGELFGIFAYYLASPFMLIICLLPRGWMCYSVLIMQLAKIGSASVTFMFFLKKTGHKKVSTQITFSLLYSLMSYMTVQLMDPMWLDGLVYLPLIMWGVHRLVDEGKMMPYIIPLALMFVAHFYIGYMVGFFTLIYFLYVCFSKENRIFPKNVITVCLKFFVGTVIAILCACIIIIPVYNSLKLGKLEFTEPDFTLRTQFTFVEFIAKLFPLSYDTVYPTGLPMIYCGTLTLLLIPSFFLNEKIHAKEKIAKGVVALVLIACMWIAPVDMAWHGFQVPNWLPYRYSFTFSAILILMAARAFENLDGIKGHAIGATVFGILITVVYYESQGLEYFKAFRTITEDENTSYVVPQGIVVTILAVILCYIAVHVIQTKNSKPACIVLVGIISVELFANTLDTLVKNDIGVNPEVEGMSGLSYSSYESYTPYMEDLINTVDLVNDGDDSFFRMEATFHRTVNDPIGSGYAGISHSSSTMNAPALTMLDKLGYAYGGHYTKYDGSTPLTDAIFNIKYLMDRDDDHYRSQEFFPDKYSLKYSTYDTKTPISVYENPYALSMGYTADKRIESLVLNDDNPFENQNNLLNYILSSDSDVQFFERVYYDKTSTENLQTYNVSNDHKKYAYIKEELGECHIDYIFTSTFDGPFYMFLPTMYERKVNIWVASSSVGEVDEDANFEYVGSFFEGDDYSITELGTFHKGDQIRVRVTILPETMEAYWSDELFYFFNYDAFEEAIAEMKNRTWNITKHTDTYLEGTVTAEEGQVLFTTIPYENGWTIEVDGVKVEPSKSMDSMITIPLSAGKHTVTMKFFPNYLTQAIIFTICGLLALAIVFIFEYKDGKIVKKIILKGKNAENPTKTC